MASPDQFESLQEKVFYQLVADVPLHKSSVETVCDQCLETLVPWLETQVRAPIPRVKLWQEHFEIERFRRRFACCSMPERGIWASRLIYPEFKFSDGVPDLRYDWLVDMSLYRTQNNLSFGIRVACFFEREDTLSVRMSLPEPVARMVKCHGLRDGRLIDAQPWYLDQKNDLRQLREFLTSQKRMLSLVVMTTLDAQRDGVAAYPVDERQMAQDTFGYAHVACLPRKLEREWAKMVGTQWATPINAVRLYGPGIDLENSKSSQHRWFTASNPTLGMTTNEQYQILATLLEREMTKPMHWEQWCLYSQTKSRQATLLRRRGEAEFNERIAQTLQDKESEYTDQIKELESKAIELHTRYQNERDEHNRLRDEDRRLIAAQDEEIRRLRAEKDEVSLQRDILEETAVLHENYLLGRNEMLQHALDASKSNDPSPDVPEADRIPCPNDYDAMSDWVATYLKGRLILHDRVKPSHKNTPYHKPWVVYRALMLLAGPYRNMRMGVEGEKKKWESGIRSLSLTKTPSISPEQAGKYWDNYYVPYPDANHHRFLKDHLKQGNDSEPRYCLRIYYFWDAERKLVVVGGLTEHLPNGLM